MATDKLTSEELRKQSGITAEFVAAHPEIGQLFDRAIKGDWLASDQGKANFMAALAETAWYKDNSAYARKYLFAQEQGGGDWEDQQRAAREAVTAEAVRVGAVLDDKATEFFANQYLLNGWYDGDRKNFLTRALVGEYEYSDPNGAVHSFNTDFLDYGKGGASAIANALRTQADANGVTFSDGYYQSAARSILAGLADQNDYLSEIRTHAASLYPAYAKRIIAGENARDIASPYMTKMAQVLEIDPSSIDLNDKWIKQALGGVDAQGNPQPMGLWDFEKAVMQDERWQYTKAAHDRVSSLTQQIVSMFGYGG